MDKLDKASKAGGVGEPDASAQRLSKCVMALRGCSRAEAERLIEAGWVSVDGALVDDPAHRAVLASVAVAEGAEMGLLRPVTVLWHQAPGQVGAGAGAGVGAGVGVGVGAASAGMSAEQAGLGALAESGALTRWHLRQLQCMTPLPPTPVQASGLVVWVQDVRLQRAWQEQAALMEEEWRVEWRPASSPSKPFVWPTAEQLQALQARGRLVPLKPLRGSLAAQRHMKASISSQNAERVLLRLVMKGYDALALPAWLSAVYEAFTADEGVGTAAASWQLAGLHRQRLGRLALGGLQPGAGRVLDPLERF